MITQTKINKMVKQIEQRKNKVIGLQKANKSNYCLYCPMSFTRPEALAKHIRLRHVLKIEVHK